MSHRRPVVSAFLFTLALLVAAAPARADRVRLVADIDPGPAVGAFAFGEMVTFQGAIFFQGCDADGCELWKSDGAVGGVVEQLADINPGAGHSSPSQLTVVGTTLFFRATGPDGTELWKTDGTPGGTVQVKDILPGAASSSPNFLTAVPSRSLVYFAANDGTHGIEIWKSDGTAAGTVMVKDVNPVGSSAPLALHRFGADVLFSALDGTSGREPWITDGTAAGTFRLADVNPGSAHSLSLVAIDPVFATIGRDAYFVADDGTGPALWTSDGTTGGTAQVDGYATGGPYSRAVQIAAIDAKVFVALASAATNRGLPQAATLWVFDPAGPGGNLQLARFELALDRPSMISLGLITHFEAWDGMAFFGASTRNRGLELWKSDGSVVGTRHVVEIWPGAASSSVSPRATPLGLILRARDPVAHLETWFSDGTRAGTVPLGDFAPGNSPGNLSNLSQPMPVATLNDRVYFAARDGIGAALWRTDGTPAGTERVWVGTTNAGSSVPGQLAQFGAGMLFSAVTGATGREPWVTYDGTPAGTLPLGDLAPGPESSAPEEFTMLGSIALFRAYTPATGWELFRTDGAPAGTTLVADINPGAASSHPAALELLGSYVYFRACDPFSGCELWRSDGTASGTTLVMDIVPGVVGSFPEQLTTFGNEMLFRATTAASGTELWRTRGSAASTFLLKEIAPGAASSLPQQIQAAGTKAFFFADDGTHGIEPWVSDGTSAGTFLLADIAAGAEDSSDAAASPFLSTVHVGQLYVGAVDDGYATAGDLWKSDGTAAGTTKVLEMGANGASEVVYVGAGGGLVHFAFYDAGATGVEPWRSDGTAAGTLFLRDINPGPAGSNPLAWVTTLRFAYFRANTASGSQLWRSDGTPAGTIPASGMPGDPEVATPGAPFSLLSGDEWQVYFSGPEPSVGTEL
ncbi:MAG TPA: ELWxxDGT repeat protein, partial [Thermoanaerobaculia bacterium]|nr:ELWxxDGT repeat protein [Thermoanaerobaculia bacterium]